MNDESVAQAPVAEQCGLFSDCEWADIFQTLNLPPQQRRIVGLLLVGEGDKQIAEKLGLAVPTVRTYITRIFANLGVANRAELVLHVFRAFRRGCVECPRRQQS